MRSLPKLAWIILGPALALLVVESTQPWLDPIVGSPFLAAIFLISRFLGFRPAAVATLLSAFLLDFFVLPPVLGLDFSRHTLLAVAGFAAIALWTAGLASISKHVD